MRQDSRFSARFLLAKRTRSDRPESASRRTAPPNYYTPTTYNTTVRRAPKAERQLRRQHRTGEFIDNAPCAQSTKSRKAIETLPSGAMKIAPGPIGAQSTKSRKAIETPATGCVVVSVHRRAQSTKSRKAIETAESDTSHSVVTVVRRAPKAERQLRLPSGAMKIAPGPIVRRAPKAERQLRPPLQGTTTQRPLMVCAEHQKPKGN